MSLSGRQLSRRSQGSLIDRQHKKSFHHKSFNGCVTCKSRKIKCDEGKPGCLRCTKSGRSCEYHPRKAFIFEVWDRNRFENHHEARAFQSYIERSSVLLTGNWDTGRFWTTFGPQASHSHRAVHHALIGLGCIHDRYLAGLASEISSDHTEALLVRGLQHYDKAVRLLRAARPNEVPVEVVLACCILFWNFEVQISVFGTFNVCHAQSGLKILRHLKFPESTVRSLRQKPRQTSDIIDKTLAPVFTRLGIILAAFSDDFPPVNDDWFTDDCAINFAIKIPDCFTDSNTAFECMDQILKRLFRATASPSPKKVVALENLRKNLLPELLVALKRSLETPPFPQDPQSWNLRSLLVHQRTASILQDSLTSFNEMIFEEYIQDFQYIVLESRALLKSSQVSQHTENQRCSGPHSPESCFSLGFIPPLFFTATRCRDSSIRHEALAILHDALHHERIWTSCTAYQVAKWIVETEEGRVRGVEKHTIVPEQNRLRLLGVELSTSMQVIILTVQWTSSAAGPACRTVEMPWKPETQKHIDGSSQSFAMPRKVIRISGYAGMLPRCRPITCHCT